jgi:small subunit ribosomal protein S21
MAKGWHAVKTILAQARIVPEPRFFLSNMKIAYIRRNVKKSRLSAGRRHCVMLGGTKGAMWVKEIEVKVFDNDIEKAMRILKKKIQNDGLFKRLKLKKSYEKPSEFRRRKQRESQRRERIALARAARRR